MKTAATRLHLFFALAYLLSFESTRYSCARATSNLPTYLPPTIASKKVPPKSSILLAPLLASPLPPPQQSFFSSLPTKKNSRQVSKYLGSIFFVQVGTDTRLESLD